MTMQALKWFDRPGLGTVQQNWLNTVNRMWAGWSQSVFAGATISVSGEEATIRTNGAGGFGFMALDVSTLLSILGYNRTIAISFEIRNAGAGFTQQNCSITGTFTAGAGASGFSIGSAFTAGQRYGMRFTLTANTPPNSLWIGIGTNGVAEGSDRTLVIRRPVLEILDGKCAPYFEGIAAHEANVYPYRAKATLSTGNISGLVTFDRSDLVTVPPDRFGLVLGDSMSTDYLNGQSWPIFLRNRFPQLALRMRATGGYTLAQLASEVEGYLSAPAEVDRLDVAPTFAIVQGGINDALSSTFAAPAHESMIASMQAICRALQTRNISKIVLINVGAAQGYAGFSTVNGDQEAIWNYNHWLRGYALANGFGYVDMYKALGEPTNSTFLRSIYNSGDNLHYNADGGALIGRLVTQQLFSLLG